MRYNALASDYRRLRNPRHNAHRFVSSKLTAAEELAKLQTLCEQYDVPKDVTPSDNVDAR